MKTKEMAMPMPADATNNKIGSRKRASFMQSKTYIDREEAHVAIFHFSIQLPVDCRPRQRGEAGVFLCLAGSWLAPR